MRRKQVCNLAHSQTKTLKGLGCFQGGEPLSLYLGNSRGTSTVDVDVENMTMPNRALRTLKLRSSVDVES